MIKRQLSAILKARLGTNKAIIVLGPRQTGKTTLLSQLAAEQGNYLALNCDELYVRRQLEAANLAKLRSIIGRYQCVFIDEAQRVPNIGLTLKLLIDHFSGVQLLVSESSALELANRINEPLTGRKWEYILYPISWAELSEHAGALDAGRQLEQRLIYGMYPEIVTAAGDERELLTQLTDSYLYKDLLALEGLRKPELLEKILQALALQLGQEVSYNELAGLLQVNKTTLQNYISLLEKAFVIYRLPPLSRNLRNEISSSRKIYFWDNGVRNALLANFNPLALRQDVGALWENFLITERKKHLDYTRLFANQYFWRTHKQQEIDYVEERGGSLYAYEFKWNPKGKIRFPRSFQAAYPGSHFEKIHRDNYEDFLFPY